MADLFDHAATNQMGSTVTLGPGGESSLIRAYGPDQRAQNVTVVLSIIDIDRQFASTPLVQVGATIRWGIGGQQNSAEVDVGLGAIATFPASFVEVIARNQNAGGFDVTVSGSVGYGIRGPTGIPGAFKTVVYPDNLPDADPNPTDALSVLLPIPRWASTGVALFRPATATATVVVYNSATIPLYDMNVGSGDSFPVVAPATKVQIVNTSPGLIEKLSIQYALII